MGQAAVDASGNGGGGTILVGGDTHGANPNIANSQTVYVGADVHITADAAGTCGQRRQGRGLVGREHAVLRGD